MRATVKRIPIWPIWDQEIWQKIWLKSWIIVLNVRSSNNSWNRWFLLEIKKTRWALIENRGATVIFLMGGRTFMWSVELYLKMFFYQEFYELRSNHFHQLPTLLPCKFSIISIFTRKLIKINIKLKFQYTAARFTLHFTPFWPCQKIPYFL